ncbi:DoxX family protein [Pseudorhodoferax soli]|uniref:Putative membrane protein YphA (DoxX/SURF4 family) n=1 Tax=Pseudorhodoferax soli TaxID=545864 RepID=A0A368XS31_9BURK|nr:DoxX family protein [Pseudorhodoferax soli]RCW70319.1 putative membrane protein YphA (DoxX/SURF4 family) [Pseudorhodoferax soli]
MHTTTRTASTPSTAPATTAAPPSALWAALRWLALLALCGAYLQGGLVKALDFPGAVAEMVHFGMAPAPLFALAVIVLELGCSAMVLLNRFRWLGALALAAFTLMASLLANRFWAVPAAEKFATMNAFFEHVGLAGAFCYVAWVDLQSRRTG